MTAPAMTPAEQVDLVRQGRRAVALLLTRAVESRCESADLTEAAAKVFDVLEALERKAEADES